MNAKQLINKLKRMPQYTEVHVASHDNSEWETQGIAESVILHSKNDFDIEEIPPNDRGPFDDMPDEWITIYC
jgi:hypothetical protein